MANIVLNKIELVIFYTETESTMFSSNVFPLVPWNQSKTGCEPIENVQFWFILTWIYQTGEKLIQVQMCAYSWE